MTLYPQPVLVPNPDRGGWNVFADYRLSACGYEFEILAGYWTDLASVPRLCWRFAPPAEAQTAAPALIHDALYQSAELPRVECDRIFRELLLANGENRVKAWTMWAAVRSCGWAAYGASPARRATARAHFRADRIATDCS